MVEFIEKIKRYIENAENEPSDTTDYVKGLEEGIYAYKEAEDKYQLVLPLTDIILQELEQVEPNYEYIRGVVACLKEALKVKGDINKYLTKYIVETPVDKLVKDGNGNVVPLQYLSTPEYDEIWTMPEIVSYDITFPEFAKEVSTDNA